ncbi:hypothetical protein A7971_04875 [Staphylococcus argenteus]|nr:hypothetical protein A7971_04875 [Staphylococcus argenteus]OXE82417.1 hypothetical protein ATC11_11300 [Staphylococcus argenteus]
MHLPNMQKEARGVTVSAVSTFGRIIIMVINDTVQQLSENIDHLEVIRELVLKQKHQLLNIIGGSIERIITFIKY